MNSRYNLPTLLPTLLIVIQRFLVTTFVKVIKYQKVTNVRLQISHVLALSRLFSHQCFVNSVKIYLRISMFDLNLTL